MKPAIIPVNLTGKSLFDFLVKNEGLIFHAKKSEIKKADACISAPLFVNSSGELITKEEITTLQDPSQLQLKVVINTTNWYDSHGDVHIPGLWKKSLSESKGFYLLRSHIRDFESVIGEGLKGSTSLMQWSELGLSVPGNTEALIFSGAITKDRNPFMFDQYLKGYVKQHSVGMRYMKMLTCINNDDYPVQKENWDKYILQVANKDDAEESGYFWAILEAKVVEGSSVLFGSNSITPTIEAKNSQGLSTEEQPPSGTVEQPQLEVNWEKLATFLIN